MKFSVIIPVYKVEKYLNQCVDSVIHQSYQNIEIILVDDGSPDNSPSICDEYAALDSRVKVIHKSNGGLSDARNAGLDIATGEYLMFLDSDDWWDDASALEKISEKLSETNCDVLVFGKKKYLTSTKEIYDIQIPGVSESNSSMTIEDGIDAKVFEASACDKVFRKSLIDKGNMRFVKGQLSEDIEWCIKILMQINSISVLPEAFYVYRQNPDSISHNVRRKNISDILDVINRYCTPENNTSNNFALKNFLAVQYLLLIATSTRVKKEDISDLLSEMKNYWFLLSFDGHPQVRIFSKVRFLGFNIIRAMLNCYMNMRKG